MQLFGWKMKMWRMNEIVLDEKKRYCLDETQQIVNFGTNWRVCNQMWLTNEFLPKWNFRSEKRKKSEKKKSERRERLIEIELKYKQTVFLYR